MTTHRTDSLGISQASDTPICYDLPSSSQYPVDTVSCRIVSALQARNWSVPGISVTFSDTKLPDVTVRNISIIKGSDFSLQFYRYPRFYTQGSVPVAKISIPQRQLCVFDDESGPTLCVYVGKHWEQDQAEFVDDGKFHAKLLGKPRTYVRYQGGFQKPDEPGIQYCLTGQRAPYLVPDTDSREYAPEPGEPPYFKTETVFAEFVAYLENHVLPRIVESR